MVRIESIEIMEDEIKLVVYIPTENDSEKTDLGEEFVQEFMKMIRKG